MLTALHVLFVLATLAVVLYADEQGLMWILGKKRTLDEPTLEWLHALTGIGLAGLIATGGLIFLGRADYLLANPVFIVKMVLVLALVLNGFFISWVNKIATHSPWSELTGAQKMPLLISGAVSMAGWAGAAICGLLLG